MKQIRFDAAVEDGLHVYRYVPGTGLPVEQHWPGLHEEWPDAPTPWTEYAVNNNNTEEIAVYVGLIWRLTDGLARYGVATYYRDAAADILGQQPTLVDWEYEVDAAVLEPASRDHGFVPGRSCVTNRSAPIAWQSEDAAQAGVFSITTPRDLVGLLQATLPDASAEVTVFGIEPGPDRFAALKQSLSGPARPSLASVLRPGDMFVDLAVGVDLDYYDSITVAAHADRAAHLQYLADDYGRRVAEYEAKADGLPDIPAFLAAAWDLTGIGA